MRVLAVFLGCLILVACSGSNGKPDQGPTDPSAAAKAPGGANSPFDAGAIWADSGAQDKINSTCFGSGKGDPRACVRQQMQALGAAQEAMAFYSATGDWLLGFADSPGKLKAASVLQPGSASPVPQIAFLRGVPPLQKAIEILKDAYPTRVDQSFRPFESDPQYPALRTAAQAKFRNADDPFDLRHFDSEELESSTTTPTGQEFVVQVGIHNFCASCGIGVAARYAMDFDADGKPTGLRLLGLCQARVVTEDIQSIGKVTYHEFSGIQAGRSGVSEPYLVIVPSLSTCPEHLSF